MRTILNNKIRRLQAKRVKYWKKVELYTKAKNTRALVSATDKLKEINFELKELEEIVELINKQHYERA